MSSSRFALRGEDAAWAEESGGSETTWLLCVAGQWCTRGVARGPSEPGSPEQLQPPIPSPRPPGPVGEDIRYELPGAAHEPGGPGAVR